MLQGKDRGHRERRALELVERHWKCSSVLCWLGFCAWFIFRSGPTSAGSALGDTDDNMRIMQVRGLLHGQGWFDLRNYRLNPPFGANIHWSRLVDLPIAGLILALRPFLGGAGGRALGGRDRAAAALSAAALLARADCPAADRPARLSARLLGLVLRRVDQRHVHARADRPSRLAARAAGARASAAIADPKRVRGGLTLGLSRPCRSRSGSR